MALGAITPVADTSQGLSGPVNMGALAMTVTTIVGDSSYPTGGSAVTAANLGLSTVLFSQVGASASSGANCASTAQTYNLSTAKLQCFANTGIEVANTTNLSGLTLTVIAWGLK
jgi:hypothetical protein